VSDGFGITLECFVSVDFVKKLRQNDVLESSDLHKTMQLFMANC
jgi:hypothetical protein